ncbi:MAG: Gfo/Idh/MocA family oxidoreductase [Pseudomonadota bacterium]
MRRLRVGLLGIGKIARDQHIPVLQSSERFELVACASRNAHVEGVASFTDLPAMLSARPDIDCISICTPPQAHFSAAALALEAGKHVLLEKPPATTTREIALLAAQAARLGPTLFQSWHSRFAAGVAPARDWLRKRTLKRGRIVWKEDVRIWHPGQQWIWEAGGYGVFDPGINALSMLTGILSAEVLVTSARLKFPANKQAPIAADLRMRTEDGVSIEAEFDFRYTGVQTWDIELDTDQGALKLAMGGSKFSIDGAPQEPGDLRGEYARLYDHFFELCEARKSEVDWRPMQLVADAFLIGECEIVEPFID